MAAFFRLQASNQLHRMSVSGRLLTIAVQHANVRLAVDSGHFHIETAGPLRTRF